MVVRSIRDNTRYDLELFGIIQFQIEKPTLLLLLAKTTTHGIMIQKGVIIISNLVIIKKEEPMTSSVIIAKELNITHRAVTELVNKYKNDLNDFGVFTVETEKPTSKKGGRPMEIIYLNEAQTYFIIALMRNIGNVSNFKKMIVKDFMKMKKALLNISIRQNNEQWKEIRDQGKLSRKNETNTIKEFIEYATNQGSKNANKYYANITSMENKALFILEQKFPNVRELLTGQQLMVISTADQIVSHALKDGMNDNMHYKEIYQLAKERVETFASVMPKTPVIMLEECNEQLKLKQTLK